MNVKTLRQSNAVGVRRPAMGGAGDAQRWSTANEERGRLVFGLMAEDDAVLAVRASDARKRRQRFMMISSDLQEYRNRKRIATRLQELLQEGN